MTATSNESTPHSPDSINVLQQLSKAEAPISLTLKIDRSVGKIAAWVIALIVTSSILMGAGIVLAIWMIFSYSKAEREARMQQYYLIEVDGKLIEQGIKPPEGGYQKFKETRERDK